MKVITVIQSWAILIAVGEKKFETRSWATKHRVELAIHAGKKIDKMACRRQPIKSVLAKHGYDETNLPTGVIIARTILSDSVEVLEDSGHWARLRNDDVAKGNEYAFGWYEPGRFAWELMDVQQLKEPIPAKGQLGLWNYPSTIT